MSGTMLAQAIPVLVSPFLTRLFTPAEIGNLGLFTAIINVAGQVACGRYEMAVLIPKSEREAGFLYWIAIRVAVISSLLFLVIFLLLERSSITDLLRTNEWFYLLPVSIFLFGFFNATNYLATRWKRFTLVSSSRVAQSFTASGLQLVFGLIGFLKSGLILAYVIGQLLSSLFIASRVQGVFKYFSIKQQSLFSTAKRYKDYLLVNAPSALMDSISLFAPVFFIKIGYGSENLGYYTMAQRLITLPTILVGQAISQVFLQRITSYHGDRKKIKYDLFATLRWLIVLATIISIGIYFLAPFAFSLVFGSEWRFSGELASIMSFSFFIRLIVNPVSPVFIATNELRLLAKWQTGYFIGIIILSFIAIHLYSVTGTVWAYAAFDWLVYGIYFYLIMKILKQ